MTTPTTALEIIQTWKSTPAIRQAFKTLGNYHAYIENPACSPLKILEYGGKISIVENKDQQISPETALNILQNWKNDPAIRTEFTTLNIYQSYITAVMTGKVRIIGRR